jgi:hypothetical protein
MSKAVVTTFELRISRALRYRLMSTEANGFVIRPDIIAILDAVDVEAPNQ